MFLRVFVFPSVLLFCCFCRRGLKRWGCGGRSHIFVSLFFFLCCVLRTHIKLSFTFLASSVSMLHAAGIMIITKPTTKTKGKAAYHRLTMQSEITTPTGPCCAAAKESCFLGLAHFLLVCVREGFFGSRPYLLHHFLVLLIFLLVSPFSFCLHDYTTRVSPFPFSR
jgi:hypothetical protein